MAGPGVEQPTIPLQQKLLICTFLLMTKERNTKEVVLGKVSNLKKNNSTLGFAGPVHIYCNLMTMFSFFAVP